MQQIETHTISIIWWIKVAERRVPHINYPISIKITAESLSNIGIERSRSSHLAHTMREYKNVYHHDFG